MFDLHGGENQHGGGDAWRGVHGGGGRGGHAYSKQPCWPSLHVQMTPEARRDPEVARLKVTAMSGEPRIPDYPPPPTLPVRSGRFIS